MKRRVCLVLLVAVGGCSLDFSLENRPCPLDKACGPGLGCVESPAGTFTCRADAGGGEDAGSDAGVDGGGADAGSFDAGPTACGSVVCAPWQVCVNSACFDLSCSGVDCDGGVCEKGQCFPASCGTPDCAGGTLCARGACVHPECAFVTCGAGELCVHGACRSTTVCLDGGSCPIGYWCEGAQCVDTYCAGLTCPSGRVCERGTCVLPSATETDCANGVDDDGNQGADCGDPDCDGRLCNDGNQCTSSDVCVADAGCAGSINPGACVSPPGPCFEALGTCELDGGVCRYALRTGACDDGVACTANDVCQGDGGCAGTPTVSAGPDQCTRLVCSLSSGIPTRAVSVGAPCDAGLCEMGGTCQANATCSGTAKTCPPTPATCRVARCQPSTGGCVDMVAPQGSPCDLSNCKVSTCLATGNCNGGTGVARPDGTDAGSDGRHRCCGGEEKDITSDPQNCGGCGLTCTSGGGCHRCGNVGVCRCGNGMSCVAGASCMVTPSGDFCFVQSTTACLQGQAIVTAQCSQAMVPACSYP